VIVVIRGQLTVVVKEESWDCIELVVFPNVVGRICKHVMIAPI
jgi:hypothetical protein